MRNKKICLWISSILVWIWVLTASGAGNTIPTFHAFLTKDQVSPSPATQFSFNDRIALLIDWNGLTGTHEAKVLWIRPGGEAHEKNQFNFTVPSQTLSYRTSACCLDFRKKRFFLSAKQMSYIGTWKVQLFLDKIFLSEYSFTIS
jgi:hypothetical protein